MTQPQTQTHLEREIHEQPQVIRELLTREVDAVRDLVAAIRAFDPVFLWVAARGTSDNAARYVQYLSGAAVGLPVGLATPSLHTIYDAAPRLGRALVLGISQSGQAADVLRVIEDGKQQGALTVAITNDPASPLAQAADHHLWIGAGEEISVAATKTYTASLTVAALLLSEIADDERRRDQLAALPEAVEQTLSLCAELDVARYRYMDQFVTLGRGYNYSTAFEINLKIKELCYLVGDAYSEADFRHGPIATVHPGFPAFVIAPAGPTLPLMDDLLTKLQERRAEPVVISNDAALLGRATTPLRIPQLPEWISPVVAVIPGQLFAWKLAALRGHDVDHPGQLRKVTVTQ